MTVRQVRIRPGVGMLTLFPAMNYRQWYALGEFVDNSIQSYEQHRERLRDLHGGSFKLKIDIEFVVGSAPQIIIRDNAAGINEVDALRAFTPAVPPPDRSGISQFGIGMKSAATWYANDFSIKSSALGEDVTRLVEFNIPRIVAEDREELDLLEMPAPREAHGTEIVLSDLHHPVPAGRTLGKVRAFIASIYREFIRRGDVVITVGDERLRYQAPLLLEAPYWDTDRGPGQGAALQQWQVPLDFELRESWLADQTPDRADRPPRVRGWMGILETGSTRQSGAALIWRGKVVVGAGTMAQGDEDSYRPSEIWGATTTHIFQRLVGELDVSDLKVTAFKDQIDWREGQEEELKECLKRALEGGDAPLLRMARNYRSTARTVEAKNTVESALVGAVEAISPGATWTVPEAVPEESVRPRPAEVEARRRVASEGGIPIEFEVVLAPGDPDWLRLNLEEGCFLVTLNRAHPFMESFANLPGADLNPVFRLALGLALAEVKARQSGIEQPMAIRRWLNAALASDLASRRSMSEASDA